MPLLFSGAIHVQYGQAYIEAGARFDGDMARCFTGQSNGLCGGAAPGILFLVTGLHTGLVGMEIALHESAPEADAAWDEGVDVSLQVSGGAVSLVEWAEERGTPLALMAGSYRARYSARQMDEGAALDTNIGPDPVDRYRLDFWPAPPATDRIVRQVSETAAYWHGWARSLTAD